VTRRDRRPPSLVSRRAFLAGGAGVVLLAACGGNGDDDATATTARATTTAAGSRLGLVKFFGDDFLVPGTEQRATFGVADAEGVVTGDVPATLDFTIVSEGSAVGAPITVASHAEDLPRPYYPLVFTVPRAGFYTARTTIGGEAAEATFGVVDESSVPQVGQPMPAVDTPTVGDGHGVDPICTADPQCPLHEVTLSKALGEDRPVALLISTPKFCQVAICGPVLDVLLAQQQAFPDIRMIHAEVYTDETTDTVAPVIEAFGLTYEPALFTASSDGRVAARLDNIFDTAELTATLGALS
jgi:hypothetical protein